jgi:hypothetical protein
MEPLYYYFDNVKRTALIIKRKQPFLDWLVLYDPNDNKPSLLEESDVYLLPNFDEKSQMENWLKKNFDDIFSDQLNNWYTDETMWVQNRTFKLFKTWFDYSLHTMIYDTLEEPIEKV